MNSYVTDILIIYLTILNAQYYMCRLQRLGIVPTVGDIKTAHISAMNITLFLKSYI